jgi:hypothetical protein
MKKDFIWYWLEPERSANADIEMNSFYRKINYKHFDNYLDLLDEIKDKRDEFGIIQEVNLKIRDTQIYIPKSWSGLEEKTRNFQNRDQITVDNFEKCLGEAISIGFKLGGYPHFSNEVTMYPLNFAKNFDGLIFYEKLILGEGSKRGILPPPTVFLTNVSYDRIKNSIQKIKSIWADKHGIKDPNQSKVGYIHKWEDYGDITKKFLEFEKI